MRILVDGDGCPARSIIEKVAIKYKLSLIIFCDINHILKSDYAMIKYVDHGFQSVDMVIANECKKEDIVITQDYGVAAMVLGKKARAISPKGKVYNDSNIEQMLLERHINSKLRRAGLKTSKHKKRSLEDDKRLEGNLIKIIEELMN
ncbi:YaiI/YqxD family protein [Clostridium niameyense]|uniref:YaiI/YqxD family protein n=1 Tax=Clostridium niameyense TaxID=1622073 RepID=UPI00067F0948|nr:YaiI/YqxD family protein [Clostridium niameyense]